MDKGRGSSSTAGGTTEAFEELFIEECLICECISLRLIQFVS